MSLSRQPLITGGFAKGSRHTGYEKTGSLCSLLYTVPSSSATSSIHRPSYEPCVIQHSLAQLRAVLRRSRAAPREAMVDSRSLCSTQSDELRSDAVLVLVVDGLDRRTPRLARADGITRGGRLARAHGRAATGQPQP